MGCRNPRIEHDPAFELRPPPGRDERTVTGGAFENKTIIDNDQHSSALPRYVAFVLVEPGIELSHSVVSKWVWKPSVSTGW